LGGERGKGARDKVKEESSCNGRVLNLFFLVGTYGRMFLQGKEGVLSFKIISKLH
jgi:hypothetical protein